MLRLLAVMPLITLLITLVACSSANKIDTNSAEGAFKLAQEYEKDERYDEAITYYLEVKNKYPYSNLATEAELKAADIEFLRENYAEAETAYKLFNDFHPAHPKIDYVFYRYGMSIYNQLPPTIDRDLSIAKNAIEQFDIVINKYPKSIHVAEAKKYRRKTLQMLADKAHYIAEFYFIREFWESALGRYEDLLKNHLGYGYDAKAAYGATISAYNLKDMDKAKAYFKRLLAEHPDSKELKQARSELSDGF